jgi:hypothetical protein
MEKRDYQQSEGELASHEIWLVVNPCRGSGSMSLELMLAWSWLIGIVAFILLVGWVLHGRRDEQSSPGPSCLKDRLLPSRLELFHQRQRKRILIFKRGSRLS